ncbi:MAG: cysteine desulfurase [Steroidobacteraceae bacterium]
MNANARQTADRPAPFDARRVREDFPLLSEDPEGRGTCFLDSAASAQRPRSVIAAVDYYERHLHANVHRGVYRLSQLASEAFEGARERVRSFLNAGSSAEIVFVRGTTEAINLVANSYARPRLQPDDEVLLTRLEHHANIVPWQLACAATGARLVVAPFDASGAVDADSVIGLMTARTRLVAIAHVSNALGTILPVAAIVQAARARNIATLIDGAQAVPHCRVDVRALDCDFYAFSGHKIYGPTGIGVLYGRRALLEEMPPWQGGGDMIRTVRFEESTWNDLPWKFEAGTPNISGAVGLAAAIDYLDSLDIEAVHRHEMQLHEAACAALASIPGLRLIGTAANKSAVLSFVVEGVHPHDLGTIVDSQGVAIRTGHHCAMPVMEYFDLPATARASFACYNTDEDVQRLVAAVEFARRMFS